MSHALDTNQPERLFELLREPTLREAASLLVRLVRDPAFLDARVLPLLEEAVRAENWFVAHRHDAPDGSYSLQVFVWPPGSATRIHDHSSWGAFCCAVGCLFEERYKRLDEGSRPDYARLRKLWRWTWKKEDGVSTVLPYDDGIHRVGSPGAEPAVSVHLYGPRVGEIDGRDYGPSQNYVCDRVEV